MTRVIDPVVVLVMDDASLRGTHRCLGYFELCQFFLENKNFLGLSPTYQPSETVTLVYTEDLETVAIILSTVLPALSDSVVRKVVVHGGPWKQDALPLAWELFFEQGGFSPHAKCRNRGYTCRRPSLSVLTPGSGIEVGSGKLRGGSNDESISDVVEEQTQGTTTSVRESRGKRQFWSF